MQDMLIQADEQGNYDIVIDEESRDFASAGGFETAIPISLFTDARADESKVPTSKNRRGWAGNVEFIADEFELGSDQWTFDQARNTANIRNLVRNSVANALKWMVDRRMVDDVQVGSLQVAQNSITIPIIFTSIDNAVERYITLWRRTDASKFARD